MEHAVGLLLFEILSCCGFASALCSFCSQTHFFISICTCIFVYMSMCLLPLFAFRVDIWVISNFIHLLIQVRDTHTHTARSAQTKKKPKTNSKTCETKRNRKQEHQTRGTETYNDREHASKQTIGTQDAGAQNT